MAQVRALDPVTCCIAASSGVLTAPRQRMRPTIQGVQDRVVTLQSSLQQVKVG